MRYANPLMLAVFILVLSGCGVRYDYARAQRLESKKRFEDALKTYQAVAQKDPKHALAPMALYRAGDLAAKVLGDYVLARRLYSTVMEQYGDKDHWGHKAEWALFNVPNYFPLIPESYWEEGDSETGGNNAKIKVVCKPSEEDPMSVVFVRNYYAGTKFISNLSINRVYKKINLELRESPVKGSQSTVILKYPLEKGTEWMTMRNKDKLRFSIDGFETVRVKAGVFPGCIKVREQLVGQDSWKYSYYAPGIGLVLTTQASDKSESRITELLAYNLSVGLESWEKEGNPEPMGESAQ
ncbi:MAG TPA: hypothetical protein PK876_09435 [Elusimicrobiota bacterium]|nr:hypothetical protein [Elusimicrobiota bacterium]